MAYRKRTAEQKAAKAAARAEALAAREARMIAAGRARPETTGDVLTRLRGQHQGTPSYPPDAGGSDGVNPVAPESWLTSRRAAAKESAHAAMQRIHEAGRRREVAIRDAESKLAAMTPTERAEILERLRLGQPVPLSIPPYEGEAP